MSCGLTAAELRSRFPKMAEATVQLNAIDGAAAVNRSNGFQVGQHDFTPAEKLEIAHKLVTWRPDPTTAPSSNPAEKVAGNEAKRRLRQSQGDGMNKTEREFAAYLRSTYPNASIHREPALPIANGVRYKVDFIVAVRGAVPTAYEVKGFFRDDAVVKIKVAASVYPWIDFVLVTKRNRKAGGGWQFQTIYP